MSKALPSRDAPLDEQQERVEEIVQEFRWPEDFQNAVYVLECFCPDDKSEIRPSHEEYGSSQVEEALLADYLYYVGWTNRVVQRILQHVRGDSQGANFTMQYPPVTVQEIRWYGSESEAKRQERELADEYTRRVVDLSELDDEPSVDATDGVVEWYELVRAIDDFEIAIAYSF